MQFNRIFKHPMVMPLALAFILINFAVVEYGSDNAKSRNVALHAMSESYTFEITRYKDWTIDWAQTPDGRFFSNKAPGPMLLGFPLYWALWKVSELTGHNGVDEKGRRTELTYWFRLIFIFFLQVIPFVFVAGLSACYLNNRGVSPPAVLFVLLALFFGNTADVFMTSNFGHSFTAMLELAVLIALLSRRYAMAGLLAGFAVLSDYGMILQVPALVFSIALLLKGKDWRSRRAALCSFFLYTIPGAVLWSWYHLSCFGSIFALPNKYQNPEFVEANLQGWNLWGVISLPDPSIIYQLLFGPVRGILVTQPWILVLPILGLTVLARQFLDGNKNNNEHCYEDTAIWVYGFMGLFGLLVMNAGFNGWHGGYAPGPRYLSAVFPAISVVAGVHFDKLNLTEKVILWLCLLVAIVFRGLVYSLTILIPIDEPLWTFLLKDFMNPFYLKKAILRIAIYGIVVFVTVFWAIGRSKIFYASQIKE